MSGCRLNLIAATEHVLPDDLHRHVCIAGVGEIAERSAANEAAFALRVEPAYGFAVGDDWCEWGAWLTALLLVLSPAASATTAATALSASALVATPASVVTMFAMTVTLLLALSAAASASATTTAALLTTHRLRVIG